MWKGWWQDHCYFSCDFRQFFVSSYIAFNWWCLYIYIHSIYAMRMCLWYLLILSLFLQYYVCHDFFNELCKYIIYNYWLILVLTCWYMSCYKCGVVINIYIYMIYVFTVWSCSNSEFLFEYCQDYSHSRIIGNLIPG